MDSPDVFYSSSSHPLPCSRRTHRKGTSVRPPSHHEVPLIFLSDTDSKGTPARSAGTTTTVHRGDQKSLPELSFRISFHKGQGPRGGEPRAWPLSPDSFLETCDIKIRVPTLFVLPTVPVFHLATSAAHRFPIPVVLLTQVHSSREPALEQPPRQPVILFSPTPMLDIAHRARQPPTLRHR